MNEIESDDRGAALRLVLLHRRMIEAHAYAITRDFHLADDIFQDVALVVTAHWTQMPTDAGVIPWLKEVTRRKALELQRKQVRVSRMLSQEAMQHIEAAFPVQTNSDLADAIANCVEKLPPDARRAIQGRYGEDLSVPEIAKRIGRTVQGAYAILKRVRLLLEECINRARQQGRANP